MTIVRDILLRGVKMAFNVPDDRVQLDVMRYALESYNHHGQLIWNEWRWDNAKIQEKQYTADADGIITLDADVESVRAVRTGLPGKEEAVLPYEETLESVGAAPGLTKETFRYLSDAATGQRRIQVTDASLGYKVLALKRFVEAIIDPAYNASNPAATPTDYRVLTWTLDRAKPAIVAAVADALRMMRGLPQTGDSNAALANAIMREEQMQARDNRVVPQFPTYGEVGREW